MDKVIKNIIISRATNQEKNEQLDALLADINVAKNIVSGKLTYCKDCDDYYLTDSFLEQRETKPTRICIYEDPINSGGNDYVDGYADIIYSICPKGHKHEVDREERRK